MNWVLRLLAIAVCMGIAAQGIPASAEEPLTEDHCDQFVVGPNNEVYRVSVRNFHVLGRDSAEAIAAEVPLGVQSIICERNNIVPAAEDDRVIAAGYPLFLSEAAGSENHRVGVLEISKGQYRYRLVKGKLSDEETVRLKERLNAFQERHRAKRNALTR